MSAIYERELKAHFCSLTGYVFVAFFLIFIGIFTSVINLNNSLANFEYVLSNAEFVFLVITPILTMRVVADEKRQKTDQLLYTLPMSMTKIVLAKYLALLTVFFIPMVVMSFYPLVLSLYGSVSMPTAYCAISGFFFLGAALIAIGMFISSLVENQIVAASISFVVLLVNYLSSDIADYVPSSPGSSFFILSVIIILIAVIIRILTKNGIFALAFGAVFELGLFLLTELSSHTLYGLFPALLRKLAVFSRFDNFTNGIFDLTGIVFFVMTSLVFIYLTVQSLEKRRWN